MLFDIDLDSDEQGPPNLVRHTWTRSAPARLRITLFEGDVSRAAADAACTSTNGRLSLMAGSGGDVRSRGGWAIKRECEAILEKHRQETGQDELPPGSVWTTTAGRLPAELVIHCVASDPSHNSSRELIRSCTRGALAAAVAASCRSVAMPVFATGHASFRFEASLDAIADVLAETAEPIEEVIIAVLNADRVHQAKGILSRYF